MNNLLKSSGSISNRRALTTKPPKPEASEDGNDIPEAAVEVDLSELYKAELNELRDQVSKEAYDNAIRAAEEEITRRIDEATEKLEINYEEKSAQLEQKISRLDAIIESAKAEHTISVASCELEVISLTLECLYKLAGQKEIYKDIVINAINEVKKTTEHELPVKIKISSYDIEIVQDQPIFQDSKIQLVVESHLDAGSFFIETGFSTTDLGIMKRLDQSKQVLIETFLGRNRADS